MSPVPEYSGSRTCRQCGGVNIGGLPTCILCGAVLGASAAPPARGQCGSCGAAFALDAEMRFCMRCGEALPRTCPNPGCGKPIPREALFCPYCGGKAP